jgi:hypothetical protein
MDEHVDNFIAFTGTSADVARRYLGLTENNMEQAIQLFFDSPELASGVDQPPPDSAPSIPAASRPNPQPTNKSSSTGASHVDSDEEMDLVGDDEEDTESTRAAALGRAADYEDDEAIARRMQEELYAGGDGSGGYDADGVRAPIERRTETLVGGSDDAYMPGDIQAAVAQQMAARQRARQHSK